MDWLKHFPDSWLEDLQALAMREVVVGSNAGFLRSVFRWYSHEFHTPLHLVDELPLEDVLTHYFEYHYNEMTDGQRQLEIERMLMTPEQLKAAKLAEDAEDADAAEIAKMEGEAGKNIEVVVDPVLERLNALRAALPGPDVNLPASPPALKEEINMTFEDLPEGEVP